MLTPATALKRLYRSNATAKALLDHFASRARNREETNFERILAVLMDTDQPPSRSRLREVFRTLERLGYGTFVVGRHGHPTRFLHDMALIELGELAQDPPNPRRVRARRRVIAQQRKEVESRRKRVKVAA